MSNITGVIRSVPVNIGTVKSVFNEISSVASSATVTLNTYTVPLSTTGVLQKIELGGENIATYDVYLNSIKIDKVRTYFGSNLSTEINFAFAGMGLSLVAGDVVEITVTNFRPTSANFESRIQVVEIS